MTIEKKRVCAPHGFAETVDAAKPFAPIARFLRDQRGSMSILALAGFFFMLVFVGVGIDMMYAELKRTKLQNTLDRAVLAAADLENSIDPTLTVESYFSAMGMSNDLTKVEVQDFTTSRRVSANGHLTMPSNFLQAIGYDTLQANGLATAEEAVNKVEISLVLDISGSMAENQRMKNLQDAAKLFLDTVLTQQNDGQVSVSLVPYSEHVNPGPDIFNQLNVNQKHGYSHCIDFPNSAFTTASFDLAATYEQVQHFQWWYNNNDRTHTICPQYSYERIKPVTNDVNALKAQIDDLEPRVMTQIFLGMKWGTALLDPSMQPLISNLAASGKVPAIFAQRPASYLDTGTVKTVVLMTDGINSLSHRIVDDAYDSPSEVFQWYRNNFWHYMYSNVESGSWSNFYYQKYNGSVGNAHLKSICDAAKAQGIIVWTVGFEVPSTSDQIMRDCASSSTHYFPVSGASISDAFYQIARTINQLRLTQ